MNQFTRTCCVLVVMVINVVIICQYPTPNFVSMSYEIGESFDFRITPGDFRKSEEYTSVYLNVECLSSNLPEWLNYEVDSFILEHLGSFDLISGDCTSVVCDGDYLYASTKASNDYGYIINISTPEIPLSIGTTPNIGQDPKKAIGNDNYLIVGTYDDVFIYTIDSSPTLVETIDVCYGVYPAFDERSHILHLGSSLTWKILDITTITDTDELYSSGRTAREIFPKRRTDLEGEPILAFVTGSIGLTIYNITDLSQSPVYLSNFSVTDGASGLFVNDLDFAYIITDDGLVVLDVSDPLTPIERGAIDISSAWGVNVDGPIAVITRAYQVSVLVNVSDPSNPSIHSYLPSTSRRDADFCNNLLVYCDGTIPSVEIYDTGRSGVRIWGTPRGYNVSDCGEYIFRVTAEEGGGTTNVYNLTIYIGEANWTSSGKFCEWTCAGIPMNDSDDVCYGHGYCLSTDHCKCYFDDYEGQFCNITYCHGKSSAEDGVCSNNGLCWPFDSCQCNENYYGENCNITTCEGIFSNDTDTVCNFGNGTCTSHDFCTCRVVEGFNFQFLGNNCNITSCISGWHGIDCELTSCNEILSNASIVCSGHGNCVEKDVCICNDYEEYSGDDCEIPHCFGHPSTDISRVCSSRGTCVDNDNCVCKSGYYGAECIEIVGKPHFTSFKMNTIQVPYVVLQDFIDQEKSDIIKDGNKFNCSKIVKNWEEFLVFNSSVCQFTFIPLTGDFFLSESLIIQIIDVDLYKKSEDDTNRLRELEFDGELQELPDYQLPENYSIKILSVTYPEKPCTLWIDHYSEEESSDDDIEKGGDDEGGISSYLWAVIVFPSAFAVFIVVATLFGCTLCYICCICCICVCCFGGAVIKKNIDQKKGLKKFSKLKNFDLLLVEQEIEEDTSIVHLKISKELFVIPYEELSIKRILGEGGSNSTVFLANWKGRDVAFKCFKTRKIFESQDKFDEFEREVEILASIAHPQIIRFFGATMKVPRIGIVMEYCCNGDLEAFIKIYPEEYSGKSIPLKDKMRMIHEQINALTYIHSRNIIHRDYKLENVLVDALLSTRLMDFGLSRMVLRMSARKTSKIGTSIYMSPEICTSSSYDEKCDLFSFSIGVYVFITENFNVYGPEEFGIEMKVANNPSLRPNIAVFEEKLKGLDCEWLRDLVVNGWDHSPRKRKAFEEWEKIFNQKKEYGYYSLNSALKTTTNPDQSNYNDASVTSSSNTIFCGVKNDEEELEKVKNYAQSLEKRVKELEKLLNNSKKM